MLQTLGVLLFVCFIFYTLTSNDPKLSIISILLGIMMLCIGGWMLLGLYVIVAFALYVIVKL